MNLVLVTDAWLPQVNGVVRTLSTLKERLEGRGFAVHTITPDLFKTIPCPTYPEIRLALSPGRKVRQIIESTRPNIVHIATEGPLGLAARNYCVRRNIPFTTAFHTKFPEYVHARLKLPVSWGYAMERWFHKSSKGIMVATKGIERELTGWGLSPVKTWTRGVDTELFRPRDKTLLDGVITGPRPWFVNVGRVAVEKNIEAFLDLDLPGTKIMVGGGPQLDSLKAKYPDVHFAGMKQGEELATYFSVADCFVFPSLTDTFGLVMLEAMASGLPVAAYPVPGPLDVVADHPVGVLDQDLKTACLKALEVSPEACRTHALANSWDACVDQFLANVYPFDPKRFF
ncbi:MAG: glycosyltransferase family 4 protein [Rhodospirillaceae bacterium]